MKELITDLIHRLQSEASSEASHKSYYDDELAKAKEKKADLETQVATHFSKLEAAVSKSSVLDGEVAGGSLCSVSTATEDGTRCLSMSGRSLPRPRRISNRALLEFRR